jgi:hypothetical protein
MYDFRFYEACMGQTQLVTDSIVLPSILRSSEFDIFCESLIVCMETS